MLQKLTFYDDPFSEMEAFDTVETFDVDDDFLSDPTSGEGASRKAAPKGSAKRAPTQRARKKRSGHTRTRQS